MKLSAFFLMQWKRLLKNKGFLLILILFPICFCLLTKTVETEEDSRILVGLCLETNDSLAETLCEKLVTLEDSLFTFSLVSTEEELIKQVQNNQFECGYLFRKDLKKELDKSRLKNLITVYVSDATTCKGVLNELVYANLFEEYSLSLLQDTLKDAGHLPFATADAESFSLPPVTDETIEQFYRSHLTDGSTFRFDVQFVSKTEEPSVMGTTSAMLPLLRGFAALFLLLCGFLAMLNTYHDKKNGLYSRSSRTERRLYPQLTMLAYLLPSGIVFLLTLQLCGFITNLSTELLALLCYLVAMQLFYTLLGSLIRSHTVLCAAFPMLLLCTLLFTPMIVDLSAFFPWITTVRYVLPTHYYFMFF
ncbi:MAG: ABC transporter permease [Lachnospiraceae bacterium]|nr:ABC transporter permease [Lachnospiraceae bacterium]